MYSLILCDYSMPDMDGPATARAIRELLKDSLIRPTICCCTAYALESFEQTALVAGMDKYLTKPITSEELTELLKSVKLFKSVK